MITSFFISTKTCFVKIFVYLTFNYNSLLTNVGQKSYFFKLLHANSYKFLRFTMSSCLHMLYIAFYYIARYFYRLNKHRFFKTEFKVE